MSELRAGTICEFVGAVMLLLAFMFTSGALVIIFAAFMGSI